MTISDAQMNLDKAYCAELAELDKREGLTMLQVGRENSLQVVLSRHCADYISEVERLRAELEIAQRKKFSDREFEYRVDLTKKLQAENARLTSWVNDLQSGMFVNCVYCGHRYGPKENTPTSMADILKGHIAQCSQHPLSIALAENAELREAGRRVVDLRNSLTGAPIAIEELRRLIVK